jgi:ferredoxin-NADP reductase
LIGGGIGITPIRALLEEMEGDVIVLYRVLRDDDIIFRAELERLAAARGIDLRFLVGDHETAEGRDLLSPAHLRESVPDIAEREVFVCGPPAMTNAIRENVRRADVPARFIHAERFAL